MDALVVWQSTFSMETQVRCGSIWKVDLMMWWLPRWWQLEYFLMFTQKKIGEDEPILTNIFFKRGWNHQLVEGCMWCFVFLNEKVLGFDGFCWFDILKKPCCTRNGWEKIGKNVHSSTQKIEIFQREMEKAKTLEIWQKVPNMMIWRMHLLSNMTWFLRYLAVKLLGGSVGSSWKDNQIDIFA